MSEILLINPRKRKTPPRGPGGRFRKRKTASRKRTTRRRRNPSPAARAISTTQPRTRYVTRSAPRRAARRSNPARRRMTPQTVMNQLVPAVQGAGGAILTDIVYRFLPTPGPMAMLKGPLAPVTRIGVAMGASWLASFMVSRKAAFNMFNGALTVIAYGLINEHVLSRLPVIGVGEYISEYPGIGYQDAAQTFDPTPGALTDPGMYDTSDENVGEYISM